MGERLADRLAPAADRARQIRAARIGEALVELSEVSDVRDRDEVVAPEAADLALHATLLMRPFLARARVLSLEHVVRA